MLKIKYSLALTVICSTLTSFPKSSQAQYIYIPPPVFPDMCGYREAPCRRDSDGNIVDRETGDLYDKKGHLIQRNFYSPEQPTDESSDDQVPHYGAISWSSDTLNISDTCEVILIVGSKEGTIFQK